MDPPHAQREMVRALVEQGVVADPRVAAALESLPRHAFVPPDQQRDAHVDAPLPIGGGQTISAPHMVALMASALDVQPGHRVLEVGGGSGYHAAVLARLASPGGRVTSIEILAALGENARANLAAVPDAPVVDIVVGDGSRGWPGGAPYDRISVACAAPAIPPPLLDQLADDGILVIPVGDLSTQTLLRVQKRDDQPRVEELMAVRFVPLVGEHGFRG